MMNSTLTGLDSLLCILVVFAILDFLRSARLSECPILNLSFYLVAPEAFGLLIGLAKDYQVSPWMVVIHLGIVGYAWMRRKQISRQDWRWDGTE